MSASSKRNILFACAALVILFALVELTLRLVVQVSVDYLSQNDDVNYEYKLWQMHLFDSAMEMQEFDPDLFWKMKPGYRSPFVYINSDGFSGPEIRERQPNEFRVLFLGDSTPLGVGLPKSTGSFVWQTRALLQDAMPDRAVVVINGSAAGYTSWQCRKLLELKGDELNPDLVITYFGNNDASYNGYLSDRELYNLTRRYGAVNRLLAKSYTYQLIKSIALKVKSGVPADAKLKERVSVSEFGDNLQAIRNWCENHQCKLAVCSIPTPDLWPPGIQFKVFTGGKDASGRLVMAESMQKDLAESWNLCLDTLLLPGVTDVWSSLVYKSGNGDTKSPEQLEKSCREQLRSTPNDPRLLNNLGVALWRQGRDSLSYFRQALEIDSLNPAPWYNLGIEEYHSDSQQAVRCLEQAKELDRYSLRTKAAYNQKLRDFCTSREVTFIDLVKDFAGLPETEYFVDHCHPTAKGHALIAREIAEAVTGTAR